MGGRADGIGVPVRARRRVLALLLVAAWMLSSCVTTVAADDRAAPVDPDPEPAAPVAPRSDLTDPGDILGLSIVAPAPLAPGGLGGTLVWTHHEDTAPFSFTTTLRADLEFEQLDASAESPIPLEGGEHGAVVYRVTVPLRHDPDDTHCARASEGPACRMLWLADADLVGFGVRVDQLLTLNLDWRRFGLDQTPSRLEADVALGLAVQRYEGLADALQTSGLVGTPVIINLIDPEGVDLGGRRGQLDSGGTIRIYER